MSAGNEREFIDFQQSKVKEVRTIKCDKCGQWIDTIDEETKAYIPAYQVRMGHFEDGCFVPDEDVGHYCSECLAKGA